MSATRVCPACRASRLSRYNPDPLCAPCMSALHSAGPAAPAWLWDSALMRRALARADVGAMVAIFRAATGLSQLELGNVVDGWSQSTVSLIERGRRDTLYDIRELLRFADAVDMPREALLPVVLGQPDAILETDDDAELPGAMVDELSRRSFTGIAAGFAASGLVPAVGAPARVDAAHVRYLRACLDRLNDRADVLGGGAVLRQAVRLYARARAMLDESDYTGEIGRQLQVVAAELGVGAAWEAYDCADHRLARALYTEAATLANTADDPALTVHVYAHMAQQSHDLARATRRRGLAREALRLADRADDAARHEPSPRLHALVALRQAGAHATLGDELAFRSAIARARRALDRGPHPADPPWSRFVTESEISHHEAEGRLVLGQPSRSADLYAAELDDPGRSRRDQVSRRAGFAAALLAGGDGSQAFAEGITVLTDVGERLTSTRILNKLRPLRVAADQPTAEEFRVRFDAAAKALAG
jgi:transcriptional regulator with XRE-family HTH domain